MLNCNGDMYFISGLKHAMFASCLFSHLWSLRNETFQSLWCHLLKENKGGWFISLVIIMEMEVDKLKRERAAAKGVFTKSCNRLLEAINIESEVDLIETKFKTREIKWGDVEMKNDAYISVVEAGGNNVGDEKWIDDLEEKFEVAEKAKFDYVRVRKQLYERDDQMSKHEIEEKWKMQKIEIDCKRKKGVRDMHGKIFRREVKSLEELLDAD